MACAFHLSAAGTIKRKKVNDSSSAIALSKNCTSAKRIAIALTKIIATSTMTIGVMASQFLFAKITIKAFLLTLNNDL